MIRGGFGTPRPQGGVQCDTTSQPNEIYLLKVNKRNARTWCELCSKLTIKTLEGFNDVVLVIFVIANFGDILHLALFCYFWTSKCPLLSFSAYAETVTFTFVFESSQVSFSFCPP